MRVALVIALALVATPAVASPPDRSEEDLRRWSERLKDPMTQAVVGGAMQAAIAGMLDTPIDGFMKALEPFRGSRDRRYRDDPRTLRDVIARDDPDLEANIGQRSAELAGSMGAMAGGLADSMPEMRRAAESMKRSIERATDVIPLD